MDQRESWSKRLRDHCAVRQLAVPTWTDVSDRRGGRTAWSSRVTVNGVEIQGRYWYDLQYIERAREDAAEMALRYLTGTSNIAVDPPPASYFART